MTVEIETSSDERVPTGIPGLDTLLHGGLFRGSVYLLQANPGSGKTILGNQVCFAHVKSGGRAVFVTLLTESHSKLLAQLASLSFFERERIGEALTYVTAYQALEKDGLKGLLILLRKIVRDHDASMLVIDGVVTAGAMAESTVEMKKFVHELQSFVELVGCTTLLLTGAGEAREQYALRTMVDGLIELHRDPHGIDVMRSIEITKFRGSKALLGRHPFEINDTGIVIYPRTESVRGRNAARAAEGKPIASFGIPALDSMLGGGLRTGSLTLLLGTPGSGKTLLGMRFLEQGARANERVLYFGFFETPAELAHRARRVGFGWAEYETRGLLRVDWQPPLDQCADRLVDRLVSAVRDHGAKRLVLDGLLGFVDALVHSDRTARFIGALTNELRSLGVVALFTDETRVATHLELTRQGLTSMLDNVVFMRRITDGASVRKLISVPKLRDGGDDVTTLEYEIGPKGFHVGPVSHSKETSTERTAQKKRTAPPKKTKKRPRRDR